MSPSAEGKRRGRARRPNGRVATQSDGAWFGPRGFWLRAAAARARDRRASTSAVREVYAEIGGEPLGSALGTGAKLFAVPEVRSALYENWASFVRSPEVGTVSSSRLAQRLAQHSTGQAL